MSDIVMILRDCTCVPHGEICRAAADEIERLRAERDEARRRLCVELFEVEGLPFGWAGARGAEGIAERLGWDCFKEGKQ